MFFSYECWFSSIGWNYSRAETDSQVGGKNFFGLYKEKIIELHRHRKESGKFLYEDGITLSPILVDSEAKAAP